MVSILLVTSVAGCGGRDVPKGSSDATAPSSSSPPPDAAVAFTQYEEAAKPFECAAAYDAMLDASFAGQLSVMRDKAREYRAILAAWDTRLADVAFPVAAQSIVDKMRKLLASEQSGVAEVIDGDGSSATERMALSRTIDADESSLTVESDNVRAALGHPEPPGIHAAHQLQSADATFYVDGSQVRAKWESALAAKDLNAAKAANAIEEAALQRYSETLGTIAWPPGFNARADALRDHLSRLIELDRQQVDVASVADIVQAPNDGPLSMRTLSDLKEKFWHDLVAASPDRRRC